MIAVGIIVALVVLYVLLAPKEAPHEYEEYCGMEHVTNRICYLRNK